MDEKMMQEIRVALEDEKASAEHQLSEYGAAVGEEGFEVSSNDGFADSAQATTERSEVLGMVERLRETHGEIVAALKRMDDGTYGICERCGKPIAAERLEARPTARLCLEDQQVVNE